MIETFYFMNKLYAQAFHGQQAAARGPHQDERYVDWIKL